MGTIASMLMQTTYSTDPSPGSGGDAAAGWAILFVFFFVYFVIIVAFAAIMITSYWKIFTKAGQPGWAAIVPVLNTLVLIRIAKRDLWWLLFFMIPCVGIVFWFIVCMDVARAFGKSEGFGVLMALLPIIGFPMLAFGSARYQLQPEPLF